MFTKLGKITVIALVMTLTAVLALTGCGNQTPIGPTTGNGINALSWIDNSRIDPERNGEDVGAAGVKADFQTKAVSPSLGGTLQLQLETGPSELFVPPNAVNAPVTITCFAVQIATPYGQVAIYNFGPDGLVFNRPCRLSLTVGVPDGRVLSLYWFNESNGQWERQQSTTVRGGRVQFSVSHFSKYGIS
jgi:predicted small lipoprotein YifL